MSPQEARLAFAITIWARTNSKGPRSIEDKSEGDSYRYSESSLLSSKMLHFKFDSHLVHGEIGSSTFYISFDSYTSYLRISPQGSTSYSLEDLLNGQRYSADVSSSEVKLTDQRTKKVYEYSLY